MFREQRIVLLIVLSFSIYGLSSLLSLGDFVTPFFFSKLIFVFASLTFYLLNLSLKKSSYLLFAFFAMLSLAVVDGFTVNFIAKGGQRELLTTIFDSKLLIYTSLFIFIGFYSTSIFLLQNALKKWWVTSLLVTLLTTSLILAYLNEWVYFEIAFGLYLLIFVIQVIASKQSEKSVLTVLSALFTLQIFLELFKYLF
ncbi:MAG: hypothetical protein ACI8ZM_003924 [Crocinitomix sp.]|jgi:hypothetical protein